MTATMKLNDAVILQMFKISMNATRSATNLRRARGEIKNLEATAKVIHQDNVKHMYSKRVHKNAGDFLVEGASLVCEQETVIQGPVTVSKGVRTRKLSK